MKNSRNLPDHAMSADIIGSNESILTQIFLRLPVKSLITFKSVCKQWFSLVSDPYFAHSHTTTSIQNSPSFLSPRGFFIYNSFSNRIHSVSLSRSGMFMPSLSFIRQDFKILQSCNGLLLCRFSSGMINFVCNPTTRSFKILPSAKVAGEYVWISPFTLAFDPSRSPYYKVVCFKMFMKQQELSKSTRSYYFKIFIYSSETGFWKPSTCFDQSMCSDMPAGVYSKDKVHWICHEQYIRFDINEEKVIMTMKLPFMDGRMLESRRFCSFWRWLDNVYLVKKSTEFLTWNLHELDEGGTFKWSQRYSLGANSLWNALFRALPKENLRTGRQFKLDKFCVMALVKGENEGKDDDTEVLIAIFGKVISYNLALRKVKIFLDLGLSPTENVGNVCCNCLSAYQYVQTLSPV